MDVCKFAFFLNLERRTYIEGSQSVEECVSIGETV